MSARQKWIGLMSLAFVCGCSAEAKDGWGVGIYTPGTTDFTVYRARGDGTTAPSGSAFSYEALLRTFALTKGREIQYDVYLTIGTLDKITQRFAILKGPGS